MGSTTFIAGIRWPRIKFWPGAADMSDVRLRAASLWVMGLLCVPAWGLDPELALTQFGHDVWTTSNGLPQDSVRAIAQTADGYLWFATVDGLARFDGVDFTVFSESNTPLLKQSAITTVLAAPDGSLWIGTGSSGLLRYRHGGFEKIDGAELPSTSIQADSPRRSPPGDRRPGTGLTRGPGAREKNSASRIPGRIGSMKISRRAFHTAMLSTPALAQVAAQKLVLPAWNSPSAAGDAFRLPGAPPVRERWNVPGPPRKYFSEWLPALFERTLEIDEWKGEKSQLQWIFTGPMGGFTVEVGAGRVRLVQRYFDSPGLSKVPPVAERPARHPEGLWEESSVEYSGDLRAIAVVLDHRLSVRVALNGQEALAAHCTLDVNRHQVAFSGEDGVVRGRLLPPAFETATVRVDASARFQQMLGFGGTTTPPAYAELSPEGQRVWWRKLAEYNLLLHREYPTGALLNPEMTNWDRPADAAPHYYGDNFPNCETSDFDYMRRVRRLGGKVIFEFWELPVWARQRDSAGKLTELPILDAYAKAMVRYCQVSREKTGSAPEIVGIQNEVQQPPEVWQQMALALRQALDRAGFGAVKIHMHNPPFLAGGIAAAKAFHEKDAVWKAIDYATSNMYDYQDFFYDPDGFDARLREMKEAIGGKPFLAAELCVNNSAFQTRTYRTAFAMGQLYHKVLTELDTCGIMYCWTLLNVVQPSYGWTRTLMAPDAEHGLVPAATSHQLRVFGAYSRRIRAGMTRVQAASSNPQLLATAFSGTAGARTLVMLNRSTAPQRVSVTWPGEPFRYREVVSPQQENAVETVAAGAVTVPPGAIVTLTNVELGQVSTAA